MQRGSAALRLAIPAVAGVLLVSCVSTPVKLVRQHPVLGGGSKQEGSLHALLGAALVTPNEGDSALALGRFVSVWREERDTAAAGRVEPDRRSPQGEHYAVRFSSTAPGHYAPGYFDLLAAADDFRVKGLASRRRAGLGAPLVALRENRGREPRERHYPPEAITRPVTAVLHDEGRSGSTRRLRIELLCAHRHPTVFLAGRTRPLAADVTAALAALLERTQDLRRGELHDLLTDAPQREPKLYLMEPYDPRKEPLLMIHGLLDSPLKWAHLTNELYADERISRRYQIWHFLYNTSAPALYPGRVLRRQYRELRRELDPEGDDPASASCTLVTHSMGGIVARALITEPGDAFEKAAFTRPIATLTLSPEDRTALDEAFFWKPEPRVRRVVFIAVPHRGSDYADNPLGRFGQRLFQPPGDYRDFFRRVSADNPGAFTPAYTALAEGKLDSVGALSPQSPTLQLLPDLPVLPGVALHSIIGNRGKDGPLEESSDGVVAYWSSHLEGVDSEVIVPVDHSAVDHPETVAEVKRLLTLP